MLGVSSAIATKAGFAGMLLIWGILAEMPYYLWPRGAAGLLYLLFWLKMKSGIWRLIPIDDYELACALRANRHARESARFLWGKNECD
ncbi:MAG: hypothetical protein GIW94_02510 [Candidatus Eremiobacteraeota bacterium]|nr:hypothetical protein [Candidatus Eremiobacteraeota bacterium]